MTATRVLTALVLGPLVVGLVWFAPTWVVAVVVAAVTLLVLHEFFALGARIGFPGYARWTMVVAGVLFFSQWVAIESSEARIDWAMPAWSWMRFLSVDLVLVVFVLGVAIAAVASRRGIAEALGSSSLSAGGLLLVAYPLAYLVVLHGSSLAGRKFVLLTLGVVWAGDSAAYFAGRAFGKHKLAPTISPNKTWEGTLANAIASALAALAFARWMDVGWPYLVGAGLVVSAAGQLGDLLESAFKRSAGVKDSGALLPGHGGLLDRIDALILAAPAVWWYFQLLLWR